MPFSRSAIICKGLLILLLIPGAWHCKSKDRNQGGNQDGAPNPGQAQVERRYADISYENSEEKPKTVTLPDGSSVVISPHTVVRISKEFNKSERDLELDGEGVFTVSNSAGKPFIVHTRNLLIQVLGTRFKVEAFASNAGEEVDLLSGKLKVMKSYHSDTDNEPEILEAGQMVMINRDIDLMEKEKLDSTELKKLQEQVQAIGLRPEAPLSK